jgi:hypothetical protein
MSGLLHISPHAVKLAWNDSSGKLSLGAFDPPSQSPDLWRALSAALRIDGDPDDFGYLSS